MANPRAIQRSQLFALPEPSALPLQARLRLAIVRTILEARGEKRAAAPPAQRRNNGRTPGSVRDTPNQG